MKNTNFLVAALALMASAPTFAERPNTYVFVNALYNNFVTDVKDSSTVDPARTSSLATTTWSIDPNKPAFAEDDVSDTDAGIRLGGGINFADHWGMEVSLAIFGEAVDTMEIAGSNNIEISTRARTFSVDVIRYFDLTSNVSLFGKAGIDAWTTDIRALQQGKDADSDKDSGYMPSIGVGARYALAQNVDVTAELSYRLYNADYSQYATISDPTVAPGTVGELNTKGRYEEIGTDVEIVSFSVGAAYRF